MLSCNGLISPVGVSETTKIKLMCIQHMCS